MKRLMCIALFVIVAFMWGATAKAETQGVFGITGANGFTEGRRWVSVTVTGGGDGSGTATVRGNKLKYILGRYIMKVITFPGTAPYVPTAASGTMYDGYGQELTIPERSTTAIQQIDVPSSNGQNWPVMGEITFDLSDVGEGKTIAIMIVVN